MREDDHESRRGMGPGEAVRRRKSNAVWLPLLGALLVLSAFVLRSATHPAPARVAEHVPEADEPRLRVSAPKLRFKAHPVVERPADDQDAQRTLMAILECWDRKVCPHGTVCWMADDGHLGCFESNCRSIADRDKSCGAGRACLPISKLTETYRCIAAGPIPQGGSCMDPMLASSSRNCQAGLICVGTLCRQLCGPGSAGCAFGEICVQQTVRDWACMPGCSNDAECDGGKVCLHVGSGVRGTCVVAPAGTCRPDRPDSCPSGQTCDYDIVDGRMLAGFCRPSCRGRKCTAGFTCWTFDSARRADSQDTGGVCLKSCRDNPQDCAVDQVCMALDEAATTWGCRRAFHAARPAVAVQLARGSFGDPVSVPPKAQGSTQLPQQ